MKIDFLAPAEQPDEIGRLGGYRILGVLGEGGMGLVLDAEDPQLKRRIALKVLKPAIAMQKSAKDRFIREAQATAAIEHHHIVPIYQVGEDRDIPFIAMPYLCGESLQNRINREIQLDLRDVVRFGRHVAEGLAAAHERGLIHRDIKPDNIWIERNTGWAKILDFGLARTQDEDAGLTQTGMVLGTPNYMAPEQARGESVDHRCDLFSLGSVLYRLASGKTPFESANLTATLIAVSQADCLPIETVCPNLHPDLAKLITQLLSKDRDQRPPSADKVAEALGALEHMLQAGQPMSHGTSRRCDATETHHLAPAAAPAPTHPRRKTGWPILVAVTTLAGLGSVGLLIHRQATSPHPDSTSLDAEAAGGAGDATVVPAKTNAAAGKSIDGFIDIQVWRNGQTDKPGMRLNNSAALPLAPGDWMRIEVELNRPAYAYIVWIDTEGKATPLYPWIDSQWKQRPHAEQAVNKLSLPESTNSIAPLGGGPAGMETLLLLARDEPLPADVDLEQMFAGLPEQKAIDLRAAAWFQNGQLVRNEVERGPIRLDKAQESDAPVLRTQALLKSRLQTLFPYTRGVSFANRGD